ncbi:hypothetical protein KC19_8G133800 [Ceratodon purpureus]|uniref:DUF309 domain-containing protein n=1 Tax=Ceratodon purpureus TaxID=3225 RepID=A0A8T0H304_CERPU|nr:hypothetical protein KC19_8G133800 [Ceratodon purpureus]
MTSTAELRARLFGPIQSRVAQLGVNSESYPVLLGIRGLGFVGDGRLCLEGRGVGERGRGEVQRRAWRWDDEEIVADSQATFAEGVTLFNAGEYYECHDVLEGLWNNAPEPQRSVLHGILQCAVGLYHLLNQNHRGAMVELGEGLTKLKRADFQEGPLHDFEREASALLEFIYNAQLEHAACVEDMCTTMDGSDQSYQLLGDFGAGKALYRLSSDYGDTKELHIEYLPERPEISTLNPELKHPPPVTVKVPVLRASEADLYSLS